MSKISDKEIELKGSVLYQTSPWFRSVASELLAAQEEISKLQHERCEYERGMSEVLGDLAKAQRALEWYASEEIYICGRYEGGVFFSRAEDDKGQRARKVIADIEKGAEGNESMV